jgi:flagellar hook protein FlgE
MLDIMTQAKNAIENYNAAIQISSANIANLSIPGYKKLDVSFQSLFERVLSQGTAAESFNNLGGTNPQQMGSGMSIANVLVNMSQGGFSTANPYDLAIDGQGFFIYSGDGGSSYLYSRAGEFMVNGNNLTTTSGLQVYGLNSSGTLVPITGLAGNSSNYQWATDGTLQYSPDGGITPFTNTSYRIALTYFQNPGGLTQGPGTTFRQSIASGAAADPLAAGGIAGKVRGGQVEQSNVNYLTESIKSLELQRAMSSNLSVIKMASDIISSFISKLG